MIEESAFWRMLRQLTFLPVRFAFRLIWLTAALGQRDARAVLNAMRWGADLDVPRLPARFTDGDFENF